MHSLNYTVDSARIETITREKTRILRAKEHREKTHSEYIAFLEKTKDKSEKDAQRLREIEEEIHIFVNPSEPFTQLKKILPDKPVREHIVERKYVDPYIFKKPVDGARIETITHEKIRILRAKEHREKTHSEYIAFLEKTKDKSEKDAQRLREIEEEIHIFVNSSEPFTQITKTVPVTPIRKHIVERKYVEPYIFKKPGDSLLFQVLFFMIWTWTIRYLFG